MSKCDVTKKTDQNPARRLTKQDFTIPEGWEPDTPSLVRIKERAKQLRVALGPILVQELLSEFITTKESEENHEDSCRC
jgi:hypothetical protein